MTAKNKIIFGALAASVAGGLGFSALSPASATVITFSQLTDEYNPGPYTESGLTFTSDASGSRKTPGFLGLPYVVNNFAAAYASPATITISLADEDPKKAPKGPKAKGKNPKAVETFDVTSEEFSLFNPEDPTPQEVTFIGTLADGGTVSEMFTVNGPEPGNSAGIYTFQLTGFSDLVSLEEDVGAVAFMNLNFTAPETSTWAMMTLGFAGLGYVGYRRSKKTSVPLAA